MEVGWLRRQDGQEEATFLHVGVPQAPPRQHVPTRTYFLSQQPSPRFCMPAGEEHAPSMQPETPSYPTLSNFSLPASQHVFAKFTFSVFPQIHLLLSNQLLLPSSHLGCNNSLLTALPALPLKPILHGASRLVLQKGQSE